MQLRSLGFFMYLNTRSCTTCSHREGMVKTNEKLGNDIVIALDIMIMGMCIDYRKPEVYLSSHKIKILMRMLFIKLEYG
jgi:hypothetical protein